MISALNISDLPEMCLAPCIPLIQFYVNDGMLSCIYTQRSCDYFLGAAWNILSYALLTYIVAKTTGLKTKELIFSGGDVHIYNNNMEQAKLQITRNPYEFPTLNINKQLSSVKDIEELRYEDFEIIGYKFHPAIKATMNA